MTAPDTAPDLEHLRTVLEDVRTHGLVELEPADLDDLEAALDELLTYRRAIAATRIDTSNIVGPRHDLRDLSTVPMLSPAEPQP